MPRLEELTATGTHRDLLVHIVRTVDHTAHRITRLTRMEEHMSQALDNIATELSTVADELETELADLRNQVEDPAQIDKIQALADRLRGIAEPAPVTPADPGTDTPPADNGGDVTPPGQRLKLHVCSKPGCATLHPGSGRCPTCRKEADNARSSGTKTYGAEHRTRFRPGVLCRDRACQCGGCTGHDGPCAERATVADHWPLSHAELVAQGMDPYDPANGRGLCVPCHNRWTALSTGGWSKATG